jgi:ureidoacrylate peracid hydrolase
MHPTQLPEQTLKRLMLRRGRIHAFERIDPATTALCVIDMQNAFCRPGAVGEVPVAREIVPNINRLTAEMRAQGGLVVWVQMTIASKEDWPIFLDTLVSPEVGNGYLNDLLPGSEGQKLWPALDHHPDDLYVRKNRFSAFLPTASDLAIQLRDRAIDTVVIVGTLSNVCCESSARDAAMMDFKTIMVSDANACRSDEDHIATLSTFAQVFGDVRTTDEVVRMLRAKQLMTAAE